MSSKRKRIKLQLLERTRKTIGTMPKLEVIPIKKSDKRAELLMKKIIDHAWKKINEKDMQYWRWVLGFELFYE